jgi:hypothetical protein
VEGLSIEYARPHDLGLLLSDDALAVFFHLKFQTTLGLAGGPSAPLSWTHLSHFLHVFLVENEKAAAIELVLPERSFLARLDG